MIYPNDILVKFPYNKILTNWHRSDILGDRLNALSKLMALVYEVKSKAGRS